MDSLAAIIERDYAFVFAAAAAKVQGAERCAALRPQGILNLRRRVARSGLGSRDQGSGVYSLGSRVYSLRSTVCICVSVCCVCGSVGLWVWLISDLSGVIV
eukprot:289579-Rhodomonas_salina.1